MWHPYQLGHTMCYRHTMTRRSALPQPSPESSGHSVTRGQPPFPWRRPHYFYFWVLSHSVFRFLLVLNPLLAFPSQVSSLCLFVCPATSVFLGYIQATEKPSGSVFHLFLYELQGKVYHSPHLQFLFSIVVFLKYVCAGELPREGGRVRGPTCAHCISRWHRWCQSQDQQHV
jgi:hypothetical protein